MIHQKILIICKASIQEGIGHLIRSLTLCDYIHKECKEWSVELLLVTDLKLSHKLSHCNYKNTIVSKLSNYKFEYSYDKIILDLLSLTNVEFDEVKSLNSMLISISPIFNHMNKCDLLITRTKYHDQSFEKKIKIVAGLEYSIIRSDCYPINSSKYELNLNNNSFHIAISMGGTDPNNNTLKVLNTIKEIKIPCVFWVMIGEGYNHRFDDLTSTINKNSTHEIILAKTNKSMWQIMANCALAILTGGVTSYESVYAGLPAINYFLDNSKSYLVKELQEKEVCLPLAFTEEDINEHLKNILIRKDQLRKIHNNCRSIFPENPLKNVIDVLR